MLSSILPQNHLEEERNKGRFLVLKITSERSNVMMKQY